MSQEPSHIPLFPDAYIRDNYRLTLEQHGLFLILLMEAWGRPNCMLPGDDESLAAIAEIPVARFRKICGPVLSKWTRDGSSIYQKRLLKEWQYVAEKRGKAKQSADARWMRTHSERSADGMHLGGGGGGGGGTSQSPFQEEEIGRGDTHARESRGFPVIAGGRS